MPFLEFQRKLASLEPFMLNECASGDSGCNVVKIIRHTSKVFVGHICILLGPFSSFTQRECGFAPAER